MLTLKRSQLDFTPRILYLDLDLHFSDAVSQAFSTHANSQRLPSVLTLSIHHSSPGFYPSIPAASLTPSTTENPYNLAIPLRRGASNYTYARLWQIIQGIKDAWCPHFVVVQCGADGLAGDPCGIFNWGIDVRDEGSLGWYISQIMTWECGTILLGGGKLNFID